MSNEHGRPGALGREREREREREKNEPSNPSPNYKVEVDWLMAPRLQNQVTHLCFVQHCMWGKGGDPKRMLSLTCVLAGSVA